ncbi:MAG: 2Fe-2S iron-sulfur cluster-binding protein, partial [Promethearchaeota archaeon]
MSRSNKEILKFKKIDKICKDCGICSTIIRCPGDGKCIGCGACFWACPSQAFCKSLEISEQTISITINKRKIKIPKEITVKEVLKRVGYKFTKDPEKEGIFTPCETGGCYTCVVIVDGQFKPSCHSGLKEGTIIKTDIPEDVEPLRIVHGFQPHSVG